MGYNLKVVNDKGEALSLSSNENYTVYKIEGLAPPKANISTSVNGNQDGIIVNNTRFESRNLVIYMTINGDVEANRISLYKYFPPKKTVSVYFSNETRDVYIEGVVELIECDLFANKQVAQISIICPKVYFRDVNVLIASFSDVSSYFEFPFSIDSAGIEISAITTNIRKSIINTGDVDTGVIIELFANGPVVNPVIYNVLEKTKLKLNFTMQPTDTIIINTNSGEKSVYLIRSGVTSNALGYMSQDSDWLQLGSGDNVFTYDCESGGSNLQITFKTTALYGGV